MKDSLLYSLLFLQFIPLESVSSFQKCAYQKLEGGDPVPENIIVDMHNKYRAMVMNGSTVGQPRASSGSMHFLKWDSELAQLALKVSNTCEFRHVKVNTTEFPNGLGQNLYRSCSNRRRKQNWGKVVGDWYNENKIYKFPKEPTVKTGHYTQLVWGSSRLVGCAYTEYHRGNTTRVPFCTLYVCHYAPRGNIVGEAPYKAD